MSHFTEPNCEFSLWFLSILSYYLDYHRQKVIFSLFPLKLIDFQNDEQAIVTPLQSINSLFSGSFPLIFPFLSAIDSMRSIKHVSICTVYAFVAFTQCKAVPCIAYSPESMEAHTATSLVSHALCPDFERVDWKLWCGFPKTLVLESIWNSFMHPSP